MKPHSPFRSEDDAKKLRTAMKGLGDYTFFFLVGSVAIEYNCILSLLPHCSVTPLLM